MDRDSRMNKILKYLFGIMDESPKRSSKTVEETKSRFLTRAKRYKRARDRTASSATPRVRKPFVGDRRISYQAVLGTLLVLLFFFAGGVGGTAYAAQGSMPGEPLYDLKLSIEATRILFTTSTENKLSLHLSFANERLFELRNSLNSLDELRLMAVKDNFGYHVNRAQLFIAQDPNLLSYKDDLDAISFDYSALFPDEEDQPGEISLLDETPTVTTTPIFDQANTLTPSTEPTQSTTQEPTPTPDATPTVISSLTPSPSPTTTPQTGPSQTATPTITFTVIPTNTVDMCGSISLSSLWVDEQQVFRTITNAGSSPITITHLLLDWPGANVELTKVELDANAIWDQKDDLPPSNIPAESGWKVGVDRIIGAGQSLVIMFQFEEDAEGGGYSTTLTFDSGCQVQATN